MNIKPLLVLCCFTTITAFSQPQPVSITIDANQQKAALKPIWAWFGYDEPNYTYMKDGRKLLSELAALSPVPVYVRAHNLMNTGDGSAALKWGSTNMYTEDANGNPIYNWTIVDSIFDTYITRKMKPLAQIGFMPEALSTNPTPYRHYWQPGRNYKEICTGWAYPPKDYNKWSELIYQWVTHCIQRYGKKEVESWYWELWNEADGYYLMVDDKFKVYCKMYDYASATVKKALPTARVGGPHVTGGAGEFMRKFINHCLNEKNEATGQTGAPFDFLAFHAKGSPVFTNGRVRMGMDHQLKDVNRHLKVVSSFPQIKNIPIIIGESDPEGCAACGMKTDPQNAYRNGTMYSSYTAASIARIMDLDEAYGTNIIGAVNWSFEFENQPWFYGFRELATNGIDKPVLNVFRMLGMMTGNRLAVSGNLAYNAQNIIDSGVRGPLTDVNALASRDKKSIAVMLWNYHDDDIREGEAEVELQLTNIPTRKATLYHYRIDQEHSNAYEVWKKMGSPEAPTAEQYATLEKAGQLQLLSSPEKVTIQNGKLTTKVRLPRQAVSLIRLVYE
ncbi:xylan 1,4-beta-xylosidase [Filimonas lacunae]|uniref:Xylan 1,4-beta-xylosidase n=1 Tax=Filimonas lacunae TaxID=477680 RepID=A0A173MH99_9BACT|nr:beta-xylosidase [Filimonas lacunae]BAV06992.1 beta-xylosidase [Filimonas lacunae]SIS96741.1 xylan 1,4-beta-xylosidase [Filimonas lacunae]